jgi:hypothetical protein
MTPTEMPETGLSDKLLTSLDANPAHRTWRS